MNAITLDTPVSLVIGSDQYAATVEAVTAKTVTVRGMRFRFIRGYWSNGNYWLKVGVSQTIRDEGF